MRERLITLACALGALLLLLTLLWQGNAASEAAAPRPTTLERDADGLAGAVAWLNAQRVRTLSLREPFGALGAHHELAPGGNLLIVTLPTVGTVRNDEAVALDRWIRSGNTLIVLAALRDRPRFARFALLMGSDLQLLTGFEPPPPVITLPQPRVQAPSARPGAPKGATPSRARSPVLIPSEELLQPQRSGLAANRPHPYFAGVTQAEAFSDLVPHPARPGLPRDGFAFALAHDPVDGEGVWWVRPDGDGTIILSAYATLFSNRALKVPDNARLLANLVAASLGPRGTVIFDDQHQGLTAAYDPDKFYRDPRLYRTLGVIAAVWLVWVLGGTQLKVPLRSGQAPREAELVRTTGLFLARVLKPASAARRMLADFLARLPPAAAAPAPEPERLWAWLQAHPALAPADVAQLRDWYARACADRRVPLGKLHNLIRSTERQLAA